MNHAAPLLSSPAGGVCDQEADDVHAAVHRGANPSPGNTAILARSNVTVFSEAVQLTIRNPKTRIHFVGVSEFETDDGIAKKTRTS